MVGVHTGMIHDRSGAVRRRQGSGLGRDGLRVMAWKNMVELKYVMMAGV